MASVRQVRNTATGATVQGLNVLRETFGRLLGTAELLANMAGIHPFKQLALQVVILRDEAGSALAAPAEVEPSISAARRIFSTAAYVRLAPTVPIVTVSAPSPPAALDVHCDDGAWQEDFGAAGAYFRRHAASTRAGNWLGYGAPVTVFIVRDISNKGGCSLGPLTDYVTLEARMLPRARHCLLAHEVAHACGLWHSEDKNNLMFPKGPGEQLRGWQRALLRNSRHVTYL